MVNLTLSLTPHPPHSFPPFLPSGTYLYLCFLSPKLQRPFFCLCNSFSESTQPSGLVSFLYLGREKKSKYPWLKFIKDGQGGSFARVLCEGTWCEVPANQQLQLLQFTLQLHNVSIGQKCAKLSPILRHSANNGKADQPEMDTWFPWQIW